MRKFRLLPFAALLVGLVLGACGTPGAPTPGPAAAPFVVAPPALFQQGIPPVPRALADAVERYTDFRGHGFVDWHPTRREMLVSHRRAGVSTAQLYRLTAPLAEPEPLTNEPEPVTVARYEPRDGRYLVYQKAQGGDEAYQLHRLDLDSRRSTLISDPAQRHAMQRWLRSSGLLLFASVPLDRTAATGTRASVQTTLSLIDPLHPQSRRTLATLPGAGWAVTDLSADERQAALMRYVSVNESEIWLLDLGTGSVRKVLPGRDQPRAAYRGGRFVGSAANGLRLVLSSDAAGEFSQLVQLDLASGTTAPLATGTRWDVTDTEFSPDGRTLVLKTNEDGSDALRLYAVDAATLTLKPGPPLAVPPGTIGNLEMHARLAEVAFAQATHQGPAQVFSLDATSGRLQPWTRAQGHPQADPERFAPQQLVRWTSFDGRTISGWLTRPPQRFTGPTPVLIDIHGGPEGQARAGFLGRWQYLVQEMGIALLRPNVRGSTGYGKTFVALDNGMRREDAVKDIGALLDWIATQPGLDASRVVVSGGSYGGYMSLASAVHHSSRLAGAIDNVGISHFVTFLENTESYRRDLRRAEYGDERDPAMRAFLHRISPLTNAARITKPLFVVQGRNDPRVPWTEAEQIVAEVRGSGTPVWYLRAENEGHGFARKENADYQFWTTVLFLRQVLRLD